LIAIPSPAACLFDMAEVEIGPFLSSVGQGPEKLQLVRLIGTLVD
jgi:hypothetical protein